MWWDLGKFNIKFYSISDAKEKKRITNLVLRSLKSEHENLLLLASGVPDVPTSTSNRLDSLKAEINKIESQAVYGSMIRSKAQHHDEGDKCSKYFVQLEKYNAKSKVIGALRIDDDTIVTNQSDIAKEQI